MAKYVAVRICRLKPGADRVAFERAFEHAEDPEARVGFERAILLQGYESPYPEVAGGAVDYVSLHVYDSPEGCRRAVQAVRHNQIPEELRPFLEALEAVRRGETGESTVAGYTLVHGAL